MRLLVNNQLIENLKASELCINKHKINNIDKTPTKYVYGGGGIMK